MRPVQDKSCTPRTDVDDPDRDADVDAPDDPFSPWGGQRLRDPDRDDSGDGPGSPVIASGAGQVLHPTVVCTLATTASGAGQVLHPTVVFRRA